MKTTIKNIFALPANMPGGTLSRTAIVLIVMMITTATTAWAETENLGGYNFTIENDAEGSYYKVDCEAALRAIATYTDAGNFATNKRFKQTGNITLTGGDFTPIGKPYFQGTYDGGGYAISGLTMHVTDREGAGLFFKVYSGTIKNVLLVSPVISCDNSDAPSDVTVGGIAAEAMSNSSIDECYVINPTLTNVNASGQVAAIVHYASSSTITNCYFYDSNAAHNYGAVYTNRNSTVSNTGRAYTLTLGTGVTATATTTFSYGGTSYYVGAVTLDHAAPSFGYAFSGLTVNGSPFTGNTFTISSDATVAANYTDMFGMASGADGTDAHPYTISTAEGWNYFCDQLTAGETFNGKTIQLANNITVTSMAGNGATGFQGTFNGCDHTLTLHYGRAEARVDAQFVAPFPAVTGGAKFSNLHIDGYIYAAYTTTDTNPQPGVGGLIGHLFGSITIEDCTSSVEITSTRDRVGGFVGLCEHSVSFSNCVSSAVVHCSNGNNSGFVGWSRASDVTLGYTISFEGCLFNGKLLQTNGQGSGGGFVGWKGDTKIVNITNCLYAPASLAADEDYVSGGATFCCQHNDKLPADIKNSYYTQSLGAAQGTQARIITAGTHTTVDFAETPTQQYGLSGITAYATGIMFGGNRYYGKDDQVSLTLGQIPGTGYTFTGSYSATPASATLTGSENPYTLTMPDADVTIMANYTLEQYTIDYDLGGGSLPGDQSNPTNYTVESETFTLVNPVRNGYDFVGWTGTGLTSPAMEVTITKGATGHRAYTATWAVPAPTDLRCIASTNASATLSWMENGSATQWEVAYKAIPFSEGFEGGDGLPQGWTSSGDGQWTVGTGVGEGDGNAVSSAHSGNRNAKISHNISGNQTYLITPTMDLSGLPAATLTFWMVNESWADDINALGVYYRVNGGAWNELATITYAHSDWKEMTIALTGLAANYQIGFLMTDNYGRAVGLDDIAIITGGQTVTATENPYALTGLTAETDYEVKVRSVQGNEVSLWSPVITFTTMPMSVVMLADGGTDNAEAIDTNNGEHANVTLSGRTLYKDGAWNTLCLPFNLTLAGSPLAGAEARTLESATLTGGTLDLQFGNAVTELVAGTPYIIKWNADLVIKSADDWNSFASDVAAGNSYEGKLVQLGSDISVSEMVGTEDCPFKGTFEGAGHTLNVNIENTNDQGTAPFRYISDATIRNVKVTGEVYGDMHCAGLVGFAWSGTNHIMNCEVAADINCSSTHCGGILGHGKASSTTISNCLFSGIISGVYSALGIIYGWGDDPGRHTIENCLAEGYYYGTENADVDLLKIDGGTETITNCYRTTAGGEQGTEASSWSAADLAAALNNGGAGWRVVGDNVVPVFGNLADITDPTFENVTIDETMNDKAFTGVVTFKGNYDARSFDTEDRSILLLGAENTLYWPQSGASIGACRAYFQLADGITAADVNDARLFFGTNDTQGIEAIGQPSSVTNRDNDAWYSLDGKHLNARPTTKGIYVRNGKKVVVK